MTGKPLAELASGVDRPYPSGHRNLIERIAQRGAVVSAGSPPGAFLRAAVLVLDLPEQIAQSESSLAEEFGISGEDEISAARRAGEFLELIALDFQ